MLLTLSFSYPWLAIYFRYLPLFSGKLISRTKQYTKPLSAFRQSRSGIWEYEEISEAAMTEVDLGAASAVAMGLLEKMVPFFTMWESPPASHLGSHFSNVLFRSTQLVLIKWDPVPDIWVVPATAAYQWNDDRLHSRPQATAEW
ncbi:hypothetical protein B0H16DRAFT_1461067 [Mycena metata]|uniref:Uncharacterized protein n=1 Tax=Mycena metata TaxID=1033252 RepID=A0AAD7ISP5_9AGAR|nr:hypothetical protein B0H16DRAFT_1461067 [Mycena metata]